MVERRSGDSRRATGVSIPRTDGARKDGRLQRLPGENASRTCGGEGPQGESPGLTLGSANREKARKNLEKVLPKITHDEYSEILEKENENYTGREPYENQGSLENRRLAGMEKALEKELPEAAKRGLAQMDLLERTKTKKSHSNTGN